MDKVEESSVKFVFDDKSKKWKCFSCNDEFLHLNCVVKPTAFLTGDLAFLATILGKEGFSTAWCCWCDLIKAQWQEDGHELGTLWTYFRLCEQVQNVNDNNLKNTKMKGVKEDPYFKIPVERIIVPVLHAQIGICNLILKNTEIECLSAKEIRLCQSLKDHDDEQNI